ncbi:hypothetical protein QR680_016426 [Steinernema hermaphroditum]|uniref:7TM GPCR serpentine receptor class x (Srx) domain-containing protein n=1 Tax=Steinernema hermaphroditum TaxID=289476 RepID=A0AA39LMK0_9BILA|nr:hypothetical protein QR680_016426 [Steinernema hermaphroditum]
MDLFLFHHDRYRYFYNCSKYTAEEWTSFGQKHNAAGCVSIFLASISFVLYVPCIKVMHEPEIWQFSCYKLMFLNGIVDLLGVAGGCLTGILSLKGVVFCSYPTFLYVAGTFTVSQYGTQQVISVLLALNRCLEFWNVPALTGLFEGKRIYAWFMIPAIYFVCMVFFTVSCPFSSIVNMWMFDPYFGIPGIIDDKTFYLESIWIRSTNVISFFVLNGAYVFLAASVIWKSSKGNTAFLNKVQKQGSCEIAALICFTNTGCITIYVCFQYFPTLLSPVFLMVDFFLWQWACCGPVFMYMIVNRRLRRGIIEFYLKICRYDPESSPRIAGTEDRRISNTVHPVPH